MFYNDVIEETLTYSKYAVEHKVRSVIDPEQEVVVFAYFRCPNCKVKLNDAPQMAAIECGNCGMAMTRMGNYLTCRIGRENLVNTSGES